jgi:hypothetical protein
MLPRLRLALALIPIVLAGCERGLERTIYEHPDDPAAVEARLQHYARVHIPDPRSALGDSKRQLVDKLVEAASYMDPIFWRQSDHYALAIRSELEKSDRQIDRLYLRFLDINYGPFDRQMGNEPFIGMRSKPPGAGFYPADLTREELDSYVKRHPEEREELLSSTTLVRRDGDRLIAVAYADAYREFLEPAAQALREAASYADHADFARYLELRAEALLTDDYYESDVAWVQLTDNPVDIVIGPIEQYEDQLMGIKTSYEGIVLLRDSVETARLSIYEKHLSRLEQQLPVSSAYKKKGVGLEAALGVFNAIYRSGDANAGIKTIAIALPNDERVRREYGARRLQLKQSILAKYEKILQPIAQALLPPGQADRVDGEAFFTNVLLHEIAHPLGLNYTRTDPKESVRDALRDTYSAIEEAKADIVGMTCVDYFLSRGIVPSDGRRAHQTTFVASLLRSVRFGTASAHGKACMLQLNSMIDQGAVNRRGDRYEVAFDRFPSAVRQLARKLLMIEGDGDYRAARQLLETKAEISPDLERSLRELEGIPVDLEFDYGVTEPTSQAAVANK